jgi:hypothetical protein
MKLKLTVLLILFTTVLISQNVTIKAKQVLTVECVMEDTECAI